MTTIRHLSDLHSSFLEPKQDFDLTVLSGDIFPDFLGYGNQHSAQQQEHWIKRHKNRLIDFGCGKPVYYILGNHDWLNDDSPRRELGWINLNNKFGEYCKPDSVNRHILFYGFPYIPYIVGGWNYELTSQAMELAVEQMYNEFVEREFPDVLVLHAPIHGILDSSTAWDKDSGVPNTHYGNVQLLDSICNDFAEVPNIVLFGHIHESAGIEHHEINWKNVTFSNAACTQNYIEI
jgi:Icc-related predicted phosphoesterase